MPRKSQTAPSIAPSPLITENTGDTNNTEKTNCLVLSVSFVFTVSSVVRIRLDVRPYRSATTYSWSSTGHTSRALSSHRGLAGNSLEQALNGLSDSLSAYRAHLEVKP